jgi:hypothetical protein
MFSSCGQVRRARRGCGARTGLACCRLNLKLGAGPLPKMDCQNARRHAEKLACSCFQVAVKFGGRGAGAGRACRSTRKRPDGLGLAQPDWPQSGPAVRVSACDVRAICARHGGWRARAAAGGRTYVHVTGGAWPVQDKAELDWSRKC